MFAQHNGIARAGLFFHLPKTGLDDAFTFVDSTLRQLPARGLVDAPANKHEPVTIEQGNLARQAFFDFGKGRHKAGLNFGDCFAYALARATGEALLFKGDDFALTDIRRA